MNIDTRLGIRCAENYGELKKSNVAALVVALMQTLWKLVRDLPRSTGVFPNSCPALGFLPSVDWSLTIRDKPTVSGCELSPYQCYGYSVSLH